METMVGNGMSMKNKALIHAQFRRGYKEYIAALRVKLCQFGNICYEDVMEMSSEDVEHENAVIEQHGIEQ